MITPVEELAVLNHEEPDRVPFFLGAAGAMILAPMLTPLYEKLKAHFGIDSPTEFLSQSAQQVKVDPRIRDLVGADGQPIVPGPPIALLPEQSPRIVSSMLWERRGGGAEHDLLRNPRASAAQRHDRRS